jgi:hypothetical protein
MTYTRIRESAGALAAHSKDFAKDFALNKIRFLLLVLVLASPFAAALLPGQKLKVDPNAAAAPQSLEDRRKALNRVFDDYWEDNLRHSPEFASRLATSATTTRSRLLGEGLQRELEREQGFLMRLAAIDTTGFTPQENDQPRSAAAPVHRGPGGGGVQGVGDAGQPDGRHSHHLSAAGGAAELHHGQGLRRLDRAAACDSQGLRAGHAPNMSIGVEDHRVPPKFLLEKALDQVKELAHQKPEDSPLACR